MSDKQYRHTYKDLPRNYKIEFVDWSADKKLKHCLGLCDDKSKVIKVNEKPPQWAVDALMHMTIMHELVHARLSEQNIKYQNDNEVELEAICRASKRRLLPAEKMLRAYLTKKGKFDIRKDFPAIYQRVQKFNKMISRRY